MHEEFMKNITESDAEEKWIELENFKYKELKRQIRRKYRVIEKQVMRRYFEGENPDYITIINGKIYGNPGGNLGGKIRKRGRRSSGSSDSGADVM